MLSRIEQERKSIRLISEAGEEGLLQIKMRKMLGTNSSEGARIALKLLEKGVIKQQKELHGGRWTYRLYSIRKPVALNSIIDCPCMACDDIERCIPGHFLSPIDCPLLTDWINEGTEKEKALVS
jgi:predicted transcriptional regulator